MTIAVVNEFFLPFLVNGDTDNLTEAEIEACAKFQEEFGTRFSVYEYDREMSAGFSTCEICGEMAATVHLYTEAADREELDREFGFGQEEDEE